MSVRALRSLDRASVHVHTMSWDSQAGETHHMTSRSLPW